MFLVMILVTSFKFSLSWSSWLGCCDDPAPPPCVNALESLYSRVVLEMNVSARRRQLSHPLLMVLMLGGALTKSHKGIRPRDRLDLVPVASLELLR